MAADLQGVVINEILPIPGTAQNPPAGPTDTDGDGTVRSSDDFFELYNTSNQAIDISGWRVTNALGQGGFDLVFANNTTIEPGGHLTVIGQWRSSDPQPDNVVELGKNNPLRSGGDRIILVDDNGSAIAAVYNSTTVAGALNAASNAGIALNATNVDAFGDNVNGTSIQRDPDGSDNFVNNVTATPGSINECFVTGTLISAANGDVPVEDLQVGDLVQTASGQMEAIKWMGRQTVTPESVQNPMRGYPILVKAGALGNSLPIRDLSVSPDHALLVDGLLINAGALVNGMSIIQTEPEDTFTYFHIELEKHALLIAEGTYAESYLPQKEDRNCYDNAAEYSELYPEGPSVILWPMDYPRVSSYSTVPRYVRKRLQTIANELFCEAPLQTAYAK